MPSSFTARWILPIAQPPLRNGGLTVEAGRVVGVDHLPPPGALDLGDVAVLPALVNAHTHLELSYLHGRVPAADRFDRWIRALMALRRQYPDPADPRIVAAACAAIAAARRSGTGLVGDVSNTLITVPLLREAGLAAHVFYELLGFRESAPQTRVAAARSQIDPLGAPDLRLSLAPHAPYSVSPPLFEAIRTDLDAHAPAVSTVHLGESAEEVEFVRRGTGPMRELLDALGVWTDEWHGVLPAPGSPVEYLSSLGFLDRRVLVVHGVQFDGTQLSRLAALGATLVSCPRSNRHVGVGSPPLEAFYAMGVEVALGTDSLASVDDLSLFAELAEARRIAPLVPARALLRSATLAGAAALGFGAEFGSLEPGKRAGLITVRVPGTVDDVEEYLVSGVPAEAVAWLDSGAVAAAPDGRAGDRLPQ